MGPDESEPVLVQWRWYYNFPSLALWGVLLVLAIVPKHNRNLQAWLILLLPLAIAAFFLILELLLPTEFWPGGAGQFVTALAIAWTCVWLCGHWLGSGNPLRAAGIALGVMLGVGLMGYLGYCGFWFSDEVSWPMFGSWMVGAVPLVGSTLLTGIFSRRWIGPVPLLFWPVLWLPVACVVSMVVFVVVAALTQAGEGASGVEMLVMFIPALIASPFLAAALYIMNLPVALLCIFTPCYRQRFQAAFCLQDPDFRPEKSSDVAGEGESPFAREPHAVLQHERPESSGGVGTGVTAIPRDVN